MRSIRPALLLFVAAGMWLCGTAPAAAICWVTRVVKSPTGVDVYFMDQRTVTIIRGGRHVRRFLAYPPTATSVTVYDDSTPVEAVPAILGDRLWTYNSPHDSCSITVVMHNGRIGLAAKASAQLDMSREPMTADRFFPAE